MEKAEDTHIIHDIAYFNGSDSDPVHRRHRLDVYHNQDAILNSSHQPVLIWCHGGGFQRGDKANEW